MVLLVVTIQAYSEVRIERSPRGYSVAAAINESFLCKVEMDASNEERLSLYSVQPDGAIEHLVYIKKMVMTRHALFLDAFLSSNRDVLIVVLDEEIFLCRQQYIKNGGSWELQKESYFSQMGSSKWLDLVAVHCVDLDKIVLHYLPEGVAFYHLRENTDLPPRVPRRTNEEDIQEIFSFDANGSLIDKTY